jgi:hypothetical protein
MEIEKMRLLVWGVPKDKTPKPGQDSKPPAQPQKHTMTAKDIMRTYR